MANFKIFKLNEDNNLQEIQKIPNPIEKQIQTIIEKNLENIFQIKFLTSEFIIGNGRIDTIGIDENNFPVIIEYKKDKAVDIFDQGLFYVDNLLQHKADFQLLVQSKIGEKESKKINWNGTRLIFIAAEFGPKSGYGARRCGYDTTLYKYTTYEDCSISLQIVNPDKDFEDIIKKSSPKKCIISGSTDSTDQSIIFVKKCSRLFDPNWKFHSLFNSVCDYTLALGDDIERKDTKEYVVFRKMYNLFSVTGYEERMKITCDFSNDKDDILLELIKPHVEMYPKELLMKRKSLHKPNGVNFNFDIISQENLTSLFPILQIIYNNS
jgi:hypothetical protein